MWTNLPEIGRLDQVKIHTWYDGPLMLSCTDPEGKLYLASWWTIDLEDNWEEWLFIPMSQERYKALEDHDMDLRSHYLHPEEGQILVVRFMAQDRMTGTWTFPASLPLDSFPVAGVFIEEGSVDSGCGCSVDGGCE